MTKDKDELTPEGYYKPKQGEYEKLVSNFVYDDFNWSNSRYKVHYAKGIVDQHNKDLIWTTDEDKQPYVLNSMGYRSDEFLETRDVVFAGCSFTWGIGVVVDGIWGNILSKSLNTKSYNLGWSAKSTQFIVRNTIAFCKEYGNPKVIFCLFPDFTRIQMKSEATFMRGKLISEGRVGRIEYDILLKGRSPVKDTKYSKAPHLAEDMIPSEFLFSINLDYIHMLELYCELNNIKLFWGTWDRWQEKYLKENIDSMDFKNYVYLEQDKWSYGPTGMYRDNFYDNDTIRINHKQCHEEYRDTYGLNFDFPMDGDPKSGLPGVEVVTGHMGVHKNIHIAEKFEEAFKNAGN
jgi:hypothetical protein